MSTIQILIFLSLLVSATAVCIVVSLFTDTNMRIQTTLAILTIYFTIGFIGYMRTYAAEQEELYRN